VDEIIERGANYVMGLKGHPEQLHQDVKLGFEPKPGAMSFEVAEDTDKGHGRLERRRCTITGDMNGLRARHPTWRERSRVIEIEATRQIKGGSSTEKRYYISSLPPRPEAALTAVRQHWGIESPLHWVLDVSFGDDQSRIRKGHAPLNMAMIKKTVLNVLRLMEEATPPLESQTHAQTRRLESRLHGRRHAGEILMRRP